MPSPESAELAAHFRSISARMAAGAGADLASMRSVLEELHVRTAEPTDVTYEQMTWAGRSALWARPLGAAPGRVLLYLHGGGFVANSVHSHRKVAAHLAKASGCEALLVDYRLSPEHRFPAALEDVLGAYEQLLSAGTAALDVVIAGDSAGADLAVATAISLRDRGRPLPAAVVCLSPWFDMEVDGPSLATNAERDVLISRPAVEANVAAYLGGHSRTDPLANPLYADPRGLPPVFLTCGGDEALRDNAERFADLARAGGVDVRLHVAPGMQHVYVFLAGYAPEADGVIAEIADWLTPRLG